MDITLILIQLKVFYPLRYCMRYSPLLCCLQQKMRSIKMCCILLDCSDSEIHIVEYIVYQHNYVRMCYYKSLQNGVGRWFDGHQTKLDLMSNQSRLIHVMVSETAHDSLQNREDPLSVNHHHLKKGLKLMKEICSCFLLFNRLMGHNQNLAA